MSLPDTYEKLKLAVAAIALVEERDTKVDFRIFGTGFCVDPRAWCYSTTFLNLAYSVRCPLTVRIIYCA